MITDDRSIQEMNPSENSPRSSGNAVLMSRDINVDLDHGESTGTSHGHLFAI